MSIIYTIDGNIGAGKSTLLEILKKEINNTNNIIFVEEPIDLWSQVQVNGITILEKFYEDSLKYAFPFQMMAYISRLTLLKKVIKENPNSIIVSERSLLTDKNIFAKMLYDDKKIDEYCYQIYNLWFNEFIKDLPEHKHIYLETSPGIAFSRINKRNRQGENIISIDYIINCNQYHTNFLSNNPNVVMTIDMDKYNDPLNNKYQLLVKDIVKLIQSTI